MGVFSTATGGTLVAGNKGFYLNAQGVTSITTVTLTPIYLTTTTAFSTDTVDATPTVNGTVNGTIYTFQVLIAARTMYDFWWSWKMNQILTYSYFIDTTATYTTVAGFNAALGDTENFSTCSNAYSSAKDLLSSTAVLLGVANFF